MTWLTWIPFLPANPQVPGHSLCPIGSGWCLGFSFQEVGETQSDPRSLNAGGLSLGNPPQKMSKEFRDWNYRTIGVTTWCVPHDSLIWNISLLRKNTQKKMQHLWGWRSGALGWCDFSGSWWYRDVRIPLKTNEYPLNNWWLGSFRWFVSFQIGPFSRGRDGSWWNRP